MKKINEILNRFLEIIYKINVIKYIIIINIIILIAAFSYGFYIRSTLTDHTYELSKIDSVSKADELHVFLPKILYDDTKMGRANVDQAQYKDDYVKDTKEYEYIAVVRPTEKITVNNDETLENNVKIIKIVKGEKELENKTIDIRSYNTFTYGKIDPSDEATIDTRAILFSGEGSLMRKENKYLIFFNKIKDKTFGDYYMYDGGICPINLTQKRNNKLVKYDNSDEIVRLGDYKDCEFFSEAMIALTPMYEIKEAILKEYYKDIKKYMSYKL